MTHLLSQNAFWVINKRLAKEVGLEAALLLSDLITKEEYFIQRGQISDDGWFFNTSENIEEDTALSYYKQKKALQVLEKRGFIETKLIGIPAKLHFRVVKNKILKFLNTGIEKTSKLYNKNKYNKNKKEPRPEKSKPDDYLSLNTEAEKYNRAVNGLTAIAGEPPTGVGLIDNETGKYSASYVMNVYGNYQSPALVKKLWDELTLEEQIKALKHIPSYIKNHQDYQKRQYLPFLKTYLSERRFEAPNLPYSGEKPKEIDKTGWIEWPDGILRPPGVARKEDTGVYYWEDTRKPYLPNMPKNPYK